LEQQPIKTAVLQPVGRARRVKNGKSLFQNNRFWNRLVLIEIKCFITRFSKKDGKNAGRRAGIALNRMNDCIARSENEMG
jgi:hypothetical protein